MGQNNTFVFIICLIKKFLGTTKYGGAQTSGENFPRMPPWLRAWVYRRMGWWLFDPLNKSQTFKPNQWICCKRITLNRNRVQNAYQGIYGIFILFRRHTHRPVARFWGLREKNIFLRGEDFEQIFLGTTKFGGEQNFWGELPSKLLELRLKPPQPCLKPCEQDKNSNHNRTRLMLSLA